MATEELLLKIYDFIPKSLRTADIEDGLEILRRFLDGPQEVWRTIHQKVFSLIDTFDPDEIEDRLLQWRKDTVGLTSDLDYLTEDLSDDDLRRLVRLSMTLWRLRGGRQGIKQSLFAMTGRQALVYDWFDMRFEIGRSGLQFLRLPETDSNLLGKKSVDQIEAFDGQTSFFNQRLLTSDQNFEDIGVIGGERLYLISETPDPATRITEDFEGDAYIVGKELHEVTENAQGGNNAFGSAWTNNLGGTEALDFLVQNTDVFSGTKALRTTFENGVPTVGGEPTFFAGAGSMMQGGSVNEQQIDIRFKIPIDYPGATLSSVGTGWFAFPLIFPVVFSEGIPLPVGGLQLDLSSDTFLLFGFYIGMSAPSVPETEVPRAYVADNNWHKLTFRFDLEGTYFELLLDDGAYTFTVPVEELLPTGPFAGCVFLGLCSCEAGGATVVYDVPNIKLDLFEYGYYDPSLDNGVYTVQRRVNEHTVQIKENWLWGKTKPNHFYIIDYFSEYNTDIHLDATGELNLALVRNLLELQRAPSETFTVYLWYFLDTLEALNRWSIIMQGGGVEIKKAENGESYCELLGADSGETENSGIGTTPYLPLDGTVRGFVFESTFEFEVTQKEGSNAWFIFNAVPFDQMTTGPTMYAIAFGFNRENATGQYYVDYSLIKFLDGAYSHIWYYSPEADIALRQPQIAPGAKHLIRATVTKRTNGANEINCWIDGTRLTTGVVNAPTAVDTIDPLTVGGGCAVVNQAPYDSMLLKVYDLKFSEIPLENFVVNRTNAIELDVRVEPEPPVPPTPEYDFEDFETFTVGEEIYGQGVYGTYFNMNVYPVSGGNVFENLVCTDAEAYSLNQSAEAVIADKTLIAAQTYRHAIIVSQPLQEKIDLNRNTLTSIVAFKGNLPLDGTNIDTARFKTIFQRWSGTSLGNTVFKGVIRYNTGVDTWTARIWLADGIGGQVIAKDGTTDISEFLDGNWHLMKCEVDRDGTFARITIDDGVYVLEVTNTEFPAMLPIDEDVVAGHQLVLSSTLGDVVPSSANFFIDAWQLASEDYQETFESYPANQGIPPSGQKSFYGYWQAFGGDGSNIFTVTNEFSRPGGKQSILFDMTTPIPAGEQRFTAPSQFFDGSDYLPDEEAKFDLLKEHVRQTFWFQVPVLTSLPTPDSLNALFISALAGYVSGGGSDIARVVWCAIMSPTNVYIALTDGAFGGGSTFNKYIYGFEVFCDGNPHKVEIDFWRTTNNLLFSITVDDVLFGSIDNIEAPVMTPWSSKINVHLFQTLLNNRNGSGVWPGLGANGYFDNFKFESFDS